MSAEPELIVLVREANLQQLKQAIHSIEVLVSCAKQLVVYLKNAASGDVTLYDEYIKLKLMTPGRDGKTLFHIALEIKDLLKKLLLVHHHQQD